MTSELRNRGFLINKKKVQRLLKKLGINVTSFRHKSRRYRSYRGQVGIVAKNRIQRRFYTSICHQKITTDTTEFKYLTVDPKGTIRQKKLYLDPFMDMFNREILAYRISEKPNALAIMAGLVETIQLTNDCPYRRYLPLGSRLGVSNESVWAKIKGTQNLSKHVTERQLFR